MMCEGSGDMLAQKKRVKLRSTTTDDGGTLIDYTEKLFCYTDALYSAAVRGWMVG